MSALRAIRHGGYGSSVTADRGSPPPGLRERNHERTRGEIASEALRLFQQHGFERVTVDDIARASGVSRRTFFRYFETKEDVLLPDDPSHLRELHDALGARPADETPFEAVRSAVLTLAVAYDTGGAELLARSRLAIDTPSVQARGLAHQAAWETAICDFVADRMGRSRAELFPQLLAAACMAALRAALLTWLDTDGAADLVALAAEALDTVGDGLRSRQRD